ncbi:MAG: hypothetical protein WCX95_02630 [Candidatus Gracilibacteria bacterium]
MGGEGKNPELKVVQTPELPKATPTVVPEVALATALKKGTEQVRVDSGANLQKLADEKGRALTVEGKEVTPFDLSKLDVESLIKLEDQYPGILLYVFTDIIGEKEKIDFAKWEFYKKPVPGQKLTVNFRGNDAANSEIGAADMLAPAVRCITVYEQGDNALARTSERRLGLKGKNRSSSTIGFFDKNGYIPIYTNDVLVVGGAVAEPAKNINLDYEKPFLSKNDKEEEVLDEESYAKYEQSKEAEADKAYLEKMLQENPHASTRKGLTEEDIAAMEARNTASGIGANIVKVALMVARNGGMGLRGKHCWDWSDKIYRMAGVTGKYPAQQIFSYTGKYSGKDCKSGGGPGKSFATPEQYSVIQPGDWIYYNNRNTSDTHGNHSALFIEWIDKDRKLARMASGSAGIPWRVHTNPVDFNNMPMTYLGKPNAARAQLPSIAAIEEKYRQDRLPPTLA